MFTENVFRLLKTYILCLFLQLFVGLPPGDEGRRLGARALALDVISAVGGDESILGEDVHCDGFHCRRIAE